MNRRDRRRLPAWTPFQPADARPRSGYTVEDQLQQLLDAKPSLTRQQALELLDDPAELFLNSRYTVHRTRFEPIDPNAPALIHLSIRRNDRARPGPEKWRDFQRIKNELVGPECEGVELYPAESRLVDTSDQFHLWVIEHPGFRFPFGYGERLVDYRTDQMNTQTAPEEGMNIANDPSSFVVAAKFPDDASALKAYQEVRAVLLGERQDGPHPNLSAFRVSYNQVPHVVLVGLRPRLAMVARVLAALEAGSTTTLPEAMITRLLARRYTLSAEGSFVERHHEPGKEPEV